MRSIRTLVLARSPRPALVGLRVGSAAAASATAAIRWSGSRKCGSATTSMAVTPPREWNKISAQRSSPTSATVEDWTQNGPYLDGISFVTGLKDGKALVYQRSRDDRQVPKFRSNMTAARDRGDDRKPVPGARRSGRIQDHRRSRRGRSWAPTASSMIIEHLDSDEVRRKGRAVGAVIDGRLYLILFDAARSHYYDALLPDFEAIVNSARRV